jgi:hypothetical protein
VSAVDRAFRKRDYRRVCDLISPGIEAPLLVNVIFIRTFSDRDPSDVTCTGAFKQLEQVAARRGMARKFDRLFELGPVRARRGSARVSIRGDRASVRAGRFIDEAIKLDGQWLLDADPAPSATPAQFAFCWKGAGARIASDARDLHFATADKRRDTTRVHGRVSVKGDGWRIFYALSSDGADPGLARVLTDPLAAPVVAYVRNAASHPKIVSHARRCGT